MSSWPLGADRYEMRVWRYVRTSGVIPPREREWRREWGTWSRAGLWSRVRSARDWVRGRIALGLPGGGFAIRDLATGRVLRWSDVGVWR